MLQQSSPFLEERAGCTLSKMTFGPSPVMPCHDIREDADVFGFSLTPDEMAAIDALDRDERFASY